MPPREHRQRLLVIGGEEVADHEHHRPPALRRGQMAQRRCQIRPVAARVERERLADQPQAMLLAPARRDVPLDPVGEEQEPGAVAVLQGGEDQEGGDLRRDLRLRLGREPRVLRGAAVHRDQRGQLALLREHLDERLSHARGDVPVDRADLVARLVRPDFREGHSPPLEHRVVVAGERVLHREPGGDLDAPDPADEVCGSRHRLLKAPRSSRGSSGSPSPA